MVQRAATKPGTLKLSSVADVSARPIIIGSSDRFTNKPVFSPAMIQNQTKTDVNTTVFIFSSSTECYP